MFTGIIQKVATVVDIRPTSSGKSLGIELGQLADGLKLGDSVCVSGACLTVSSIEGDHGWFDVIPETLAQSTLGQLRRGSRVNLERSLRLADGLDGHLVQGHVDGQARLRTLHRDGQYVMEFACGSDLTDLMVPKGSVAIDGVSLTLVNVSGDAFSVALIPTTLAATTLGDLKSGSPVNIETDIIGRYIKKYVQQMAGKSDGLSMEKLRDAGFA